MGEIGGFCGNYKYAEWPRGEGGSHIPDFDRIRFLVRGGIRRWVMIVHADTVSTCFEDARRLRDECNVSELNLRLYMQGDLVSAQEQFNQFEAFIAHCINLFSKVCILNINEPDLDLNNISIAHALVQQTEFRALAKARFGAAVSVSSPTVNGLNPENIADYEYVCSHPEAYDVVGVNFYARDIAGVNGKDSEGNPLPWTLPWYLETALKPVFIWEYNCPEGTSQVIRNQILPYMHQEVRDAVIVEGHWFIESSDSANLQEQVYKAGEIAKCLDILAGGTVVPVDPPITPPVPQPGDWNVQYIWDYSSQRCGGPGFNENDAFGQYVTAHPNQTFGFYTAPVQGYDKPSWPWLWQPTTCGVFFYNKITGVVSFASTISEAPVLPF
jgi:hypothetical protein